MFQILGGLFRFGVKIDIGLQKPQNVGANKFSGAEARFAACDQDTRTTVVIMWRRCARSLPAAHSNLQRRGWRSLYAYKRCEMFF